MIFKYLLPLFALLSLSLFSSEPLIVRLETDVHLLPIYISPIILETAHLEKDYVVSLEKILQFDLSHNGVTQVFPCTKELNAIVQKGSFDNLGAKESWQKAKIFYVVKTKIADKKISVRLLTANSGAIKAIDDLPLSGNLSEDRKKIHKLADTIHRELFGQDGIASTRLLYTVKSQQTATNKWLSHIWECDYDGGNPRKINEDSGYSVTPIYLPPSSGKASSGYLYVSYLKGQPKIYIASFDKKQAKRLTLMRGNQLMPTVSRQRDKVAFISDITGNPDLFIQKFSLETGAIGKPEQIFSAHKATQGTPTFSPDGKKIAFVSNKDGAPRIYLMTIPASGASLKTIKAELLTKQSRENTAPAWSPDGSKLAYSAMTVGVRQIWIYDFDKKQERQITEGAEHKENPAWAPNSLHLVYNTTGNSKSELYLINLNQPQAHKISSGSGEKRFPNWDSFGANP